MFNKLSSRWEFSVDYAAHNNPPLTDLRAHVQNRRLTPAQFSKVKELSKGGLKPSAILNVLHANKTEGESLLATKNTIYVAKTSMNM